MNKKERSKLYQNISTTLGDIHSALDKDITSTSAMKSSIIEDTLEAITPMISDKFPY